ncbi:unnamed protein product [Adineta steineri]|uniref:F-box domain-containing protein n=1 Tax=Adineta steineri TaxID=433720 RepID=A0A819NIT5_9BILA|nr:unnamed protein product [Adineta steineri]
MSKSPLVCLPIELLHYIFDHLDAYTIALSIRSVCTQLYTAVNTYDRFQLKFGSTENSSSNKNSSFKIISHLIQPVRVISLKFYSDYAGQWSINFFLKDFGITRFSRLRSLTLYGVNCNTKEASSTIFSIIAQTNLQKLHLNDIDCTTNEIAWPIQNTLEQLTIRDCSYHQYRIILCNSLRLRTLVIRNCIMDNNDQTVSSYALTTSDSTVYPQLVSLTIGDCTLSPQEVECLLTLTPSLSHLKLIASRSTLDSIFNGSYWEQFIQKKLLLLNQFQFFFTCTNKKLNDTATLDSLILPFESSFWLNNKKWFVNCGYILRESKIILYTTPLCIEVDATKRSSVFEVSLTNPKCLLILHQNYNMIYNVEEETLTAVDLSHNEIGDVGAQHLVDTLRNHQTLTTLDLSHNRIGNNGAQYLHDAFRKSKTLIQLNLEENPGSFCTIVSAAIQIRNDRTITEMDLHGKIIDDIEMQFLTDALINNETIIKLDLSQNKIGDIGIQHLADALQINRTITELDLSQNHIGDEGIQYLANALQINTTITNLKLEQNKISDIGIQYLADALKDNKVLSVLELSYNEISNNGLQYLDDALKENKTLIKLDLEGNSGSYCTTVSAAIQIRNDKIMTSEFSSSNNSTHTKQALLIGNSKHKKNSQLQYCINDTEDLSNKLGKFDIEFTVDIDLVYEQMDRMIETSNDKINPDDLLLFFFTDHGYQWSHLNFLMPIDDDRSKTNTDLEYRAISA